ncbi:hypothetical protein [Thermoproteus tenax]|uniref:hypothetical protein n=1 Tax=Thermoproteus tenax TaxID=2271 RepID=UPI000A6F3F6A|nr:hypothetical protein [Thermoproteus tenax]
MKRALKFYDIEARRSFTTDQYELVVIELGGGRSVTLAVAISPYTGNKCYSFAPRRTEIKSVGLDRFI